jgi:hypothetical protein
MTTYFVLGSSKHSLNCYTFVFLSHNFMEQSLSLEQNGRSSGTEIPILRFIAVFTVHPHPLLNPLNAIMALQFP